MTDSSTPRSRPRRLKAAGVAFTPVPLTRKRHDGWSLARQQRFLAALYACGIVATAARAVGMTVQSAYRLRRRAHAESFAAAWDKLLREARSRALDEAMAQALTTGFVPRTYRGQFTGLATADNKRMILAALRATGTGDALRTCAAPREELARFLSGKGYE